jgi:hypothetical protein
MFRPVRRSLPQTMARAVAKAVAVTLTLLLSYVTTAVVADMSQLATGRQNPEPAVVDPAARPIEQHDCSTQGLGDEIPASALVRRGQSVVLVTFDEGWAVHEGHPPGTLVVVCRAPVS